MNIILFGPPGAGKGTQAKKIAENFNLIQISTGDLLRKETKIKSELGKKIENLLSNGQFISDDIVNKLIKKIVFDKNNFNRLIFDGYPRTLTQIHNLEELISESKQHISLVLCLIVEKDIILKRIKGRITCNNCNKIFNFHFDPPNKENHTCDEKYLIKRTDDNSEVILDRYETYIDKTKPILEYYKNKGLFKEIDGNSKIDEIYSEISGILSNIRH